ncbi:MAG: DedA family protein [Candidatus Brocadiia bacterium]
MLDHLITYFSRDIFSYIGVIFALLLTGLGMPVPEDIILLAAGFVTANDYARLELMIPITMLSILTGDLITFWLGRKYGNHIYSIRPFSYLFTQKRVARIEKFYARYGKSAIFFGRFAAGLRAFIYVSAGASRMSIGRFILMDFLAALISVPLLVWLGYYFEGEIRQMAFFVGRIKLWLVLIMLVAVVIVVVKNRLKKRRNKKV